MRDISHLLTRDELIQLCPLCDNTVSDNYAVVLAHSIPVLVCAECLEFSDEEEDVYGLPRPR